MSLFDVYFRPFWNDIMQPSFDWTPLNTGLVVDPVNIPGLVFIKTQTMLQKANNFLYVEYSVYQCLKL